MDSSETKRVLVSAGSKHGATQEIAERIGTVLSERGHDVTVSPPDAISEVSGYHAIVLGSAVYAGRWVAASKALAEAVARSEPPVPTWLFSSGPIGDPPKPEEESGDVADIVASTSARDHRVFSGKIDKSKLNFAEKAILVAVHAGDGDFRDWNEIEAWASDIADSLTS